MVEVLEFMHHEHNMLHRDIKPSNFVIDKNNRIKLIDFGQSRKYDPSQDVLKKVLYVPENDWERSVSTYPGEFNGTLVFMSPELITYGIRSPAQDLWAVGCTLFYMLTKKLPFEADKKTDILKNVKRGEISIPYSIVQQYPDAAQLIEDLL